MKVRLIFFVCYLHVCVGVWVTSGLDKKDISRIFLTAKEKGRSNADVMNKWSEYAKSAICYQVLNSSGIDMYGLKYFEKYDSSNVEEVLELNRKLFDNHFRPHGGYANPYYHVEYRDVIVDEESHKVFSFPCLCTDEANILREVFIGDGYLEKTYTLLSPINTAPGDGEEELRLLILGFIELPPVREPKNELENLEELYYASLKAMEGLTLSNQDEDPALINPIQQSSPKEKMKLCSLVYDAIRKNFDWEILAMGFEMKDFEHGPLSFMAPKIKPPVIEPKHQIIRGIECTGLDERRGKVHFILIPNWLRKDCVFVLKYADHLPAAPIVYSGDSSPQTQLESTGQSSKGQSLASSSSVTEPKVVLKEISRKTAVVLISHVRRVSFLTNKLNGTYVAI